MREEKEDGTNLDQKKIRFESTQKSMHTILVIVVKNRTSFVRGKSKTVSYFKRTILYSVTKIYRKSRVRKTQPTQYIRIKQHTTLFFYVEYVFCCCWCLFIISFTLSHRCHFKAR